MAKKTGDGVFWKAREDRKLVYYWRIGRDKSKEFSSEEECAKDFVEKYIDRNPKYKELVYDKTWNEIFVIFGLRVGKK